MKPAVVPTAGFSAYDLVFLKEKDLEPGSGRNLRSRKSGDARTDNRRVEALSHAGANTSTKACAIRSASPVLRPDVTGGQMCRGHHVSVARSSSFA